VAQTNANGDLTDPVVMTVYKEIVDTLNWEKENVMTFTETIKNPISRKRLLIGMSPGPFSCIAGNIIASYYLGPELTTAGIVDRNQQLKAVGPVVCWQRLWLILAECGAQCVVPWLCLAGYTIDCRMGSQTHCDTLAMPTCHMPFCNRRAVQAIRG
jgi:hypothetical protein